MLGNIRLQAELAHIQLALSRVAASERGKLLVEDLHRATGCTTAAILWQSLYADCLRVAHVAATGGGAVDDDKVKALYDFLKSVARYFANVTPSPYYDLAVVDLETARAFLDRYAEDVGPFGRRTEALWPGYGLCRGAAELGEPEALRRYKQMMAWLFSAACQIGGVTEADLRRRGRVAELAELRRELARDGEVAPATVDRRGRAFLAPTRIFAGVEQASSVFEADPFDVETLHADTRVTFERMVEHAISPSQPTDGSRMLLVLGDAGAGKTHLLRGFRRHVQEFGRGFVAYAQLSASSEDYPRYLLKQVIKSLALPYAGTAGEQTGLQELASGLSWRVGESLRSRVEWLGRPTWEGPGSLADYINSLVDEILKREDLSSFDPDLLRVMLFALRRDPATNARVYKYLRCEDLNDADRKCIGDVVPRTGKDDPSSLLGQLARLAFATRRAAFVLMVDQAELVGFDGNTGTVFRRAIDALYRIVNEERSVIAVVACLSDLYSQVRDQLIRSAIDRLEKDPPIKRLQINRSYAEIEAIVSRRLSWLFALDGAAHRPDSPVYPIPEEQLRSLTNRRTRDVLEWCHEFQDRCAIAHKIVDDGEDEGEKEKRDAKEKDAKEKDAKEKNAQEKDAKEKDAKEKDAKEKDAQEKKEKDAQDLDQIAAAWKDATSKPGLKVPADEEETILAILRAAAQACADEAGLELVTPPSKNGVLRVQLVGPRSQLAIAVTNRNYHRGAFIVQLDELRRAAGTATPVAVRTLELPRGEASDKAVARLVKDDGRCVCIDKPTLRALVVSQRFAPPFPADRVTAWRRRDRPISGLPAVAEIFGLGSPPSQPRAEPPPEPTPTRTKAKSTRGSSSGSRTSR